MDVEIDISTHNLAEQTCKALGGKVSLEDVLTIWHSIGKLESSALHNPYVVSPLSTPAILLPVSCLLSQATW
jgi:hypothetical protein